MSKCLINPQHKEEIEKIRKSVTERAEENIHHFMPSKVIELNDILKSEAFDLNLSKFRQSILNDLNQLNVAIKSGSSHLLHITNEDFSLHEGPVKKAKFNEQDSDLNLAASNVKNATFVPCNDFVVNALKVMKEHVMHFIETVSALKIWIQLNIPRIEDGNNFGVSIQEETLNELGRAEEAACCNLDHAPKYFLNRAKYIAKLFKYPGISDYQHSIIELDEREFVNSVMTLKDIKNNYSIFHDMITKNWAKIRKPRSDNDSTLY